MREWRAESMVRRYRSATFENKEEILNSEACKRFARIMKAYLDQIVEVPMRPRDERVDKFYETARLHPEILQCLRNLPLEWQIVIIAHAQTSRNFIKTKKLKCSTDVEDMYVLPMRTDIALGLMSCWYWEEMLKLGAEYAHQRHSEATPSPIDPLTADAYRSVLPDASHLSSAADSCQQLKGSEAVLVYDKTASSSREDTLARNVVHCKFKVVSLFDIPSFDLTMPLRVFSDQQLEEHESSPQPALKALIQSVLGDDAMRADQKPSRPREQEVIHWDCGLIWTNTYPFWHWENGTVRLDISLEAGTHVKYTPFSETQLFTPLLEASRHMTLMLPPGSLHIADVSKVPRLAQNDFEDTASAFQEQDIYVIRCHYKPKLGRQASF